MTVIFETNKVWCLVCRINSSKNTLTLFKGQSILFRMQSRVYYLLFIRIEKLKLHPTVKNYFYDKNQRRLTLHIVI